MIYYENRVLIIFTWTKFWKTELAISIKLDLHFFLYYFKIELKIFRDRRLYDSLQFNEHHKTFSKLLFQYNIIKWKFSSNYKQHFCSWQIWSRCFSSKNAATNFVWDDEEKRKMKKNRSLYSKKMNITYVFLGIRPLVCRLIVFLSHEKSETNE